MATKSKEQVIDAAAQVFLRYGFGRTTMGELAEAAQMSRPALYLLFPSKEEIFRALMKRALTASIDEIRNGLAARSSPHEKLAFAFEVWSVKPFDLMQSSPDAKDLFESTLAFTADIKAEATGAFVDLAAGVLRPLVARQKRAALTDVGIARMLVSAVHGFKAGVKTGAELRELIDALLTVVLAGVGPATARPGRSAG